MENHRKETMWKVLTILTILSGLLYVVDCEKAICEQDPVEVDEDFIACCKGKPVFTSEPCVDALFENGTFTQECLIECLYKDFHIYDVNNGINLTAVDHFFEENVHDLDMRQMFLNAYRRCSEFDREALLQTLSFTDIEVGNEYGCDTYSSYIDRCVWYHTLSHCPERSKSTDEQCTKKQLWVRECLLK